MRAINRRRYFNSVESDYDASTSGMQSNIGGAGPLAPSTATITTQPNMIPIYIAGVIALIGILALIRSKP